MRKIKIIGILAIVLIAACIVTVIASKHETKQEEIKESGETVLEFDTDSVTGIAWNYDMSKDNNDSSSDTDSDSDTYYDTDSDTSSDTDTNQSGEFSFTKNEDGTWMYDEDDTFPVNQDKINELINVFAQFNAAFDIEDVDDYSQYGLDDPVCTITLTTADQTYEIKLGAYSKMDSERYVSTGDGHVYLAVDDPMTSYQLEQKNLIQNDEIPAMDTVTQLDFTGADTYTAKYDEESTASYNEDDVYFTDKNGSEEPLDTTLVDDYIDTIQDLSLTEYVTYNASDEDLSQYGLDDPEVTVSLAYTPEQTDTSSDDSSDAETITLSVGLDPDVDLEALEEEDTSEDTSEVSDDTIVGYLRVNDSEIIYELDESTYEALIACTYDDLRHQDMYYGDFDEITQIDVTLDGESYTLTSDTSGSTTTWYYGDTEIEDTSNLSSALVSLTADRFTTDATGDPEEISITLHLDNENISEVSYSFYRYDGNDCVAEANGNVTALVSRDHVVNLIEAVNAIVL